ncbi:YajG family lipoprotein [Vibrio gallicus]|uniref:YajG family lipoprotein n=1 Tax=Vibrio gallicus TaxID=190897 RepID=UPI0021C3162E|nr:YajG family lipoprotein [Vibrio gallicus]
MRHLLIAACTMLALSGCASPTSEQLNFTPTTDNSQIALHQAKSVTLTTKDIRTAQYLALVKKNEDKALPIHAKQNVRVALNNALQGALQKQGFNIVPNSDNHIQLEVQEALVRVSSSTFSNQMQAKVTLTVTAETKAGKFVKTYTGSAKGENSMGASNEQIEHIINHVSKLVLNEITNDVELIDYMEETFK